MKLQKKCMTSKRLKIVKFFKKIKFRKNRTTNRNFIISFVEKILKNVSENQYQ